MLPGNAHVNIVDIHARGRFERLRSLLQSLDNSVELVGVLQREIPAFEHAHGRSIRHADEQIDFRGTDVQTEQQVLFPYFIFGFIH